MCYSLSRLFLASSHKLLGLGCGSGALTALMYLVLQGNMAGTVPTEM
jgi:precorrin-6B methylase 2